MRYRSVFIGLMLIIPVTLWLLTDPDSGIIENIPFGGGLISVLTAFSISMLGIALIYLSRKGMHDYPVADFEQLGKTAVRTPEGAASYAIAISIKVLAYAIVIAAGIIGVLLG